MIKFFKNDNTVPVDLVDQDGLRYRCRGRISSVRVGQPFIGKKTSRKVKKLSSGYEYVSMDNPTLLAEVMRRRALKARNVQAIS